ncbi:MAG: AI-2E family transporter [Candidatus Villigracilaceae bacterium]
MKETPVSSSPRWGLGTKLVIGFTLVALAAAFLVKFRYLIGPLIIAFILAYLLHPIADFLHRKLNRRWNLAVGLVYLFLVLLLLGLLTAGGVGLLQQMQSVIDLVNRGLNELPLLFEQLSHQAYQIGPFELDFSNIRMDTLGDQVLANAQNLLGRLGSLIGTLAGRAAEAVGWMFFVLITSYFILVESGGLRERIIEIDLPGYTDDLRRLGEQLERIWNAFLRGQVIIVGLAVLVYTVLLSLLGVRYALGLALLAGVARFVPYVGPAVNWVVLFLVTYFQTYKLFGMQPLTYSLVVLIAALLVDQIFDNYVSPRVMSQTLKVHPAAVLVAALVIASLIGFIGIVVAAPILATFTLIGRYVLRKMFDLDPWPEEEAPSVPAGPGAWDRFRGWLTCLRQKFCHSKNEPR